MTSIRRDEYGTADSCFSRLLSMALMALPVMAVVFLTRLAMVRLRVPRKYSCALWFAVGVRLVCPVSLRGLLSIFDLPGLYDLAEATGSVDGGVVAALPPVTAAWLQLRRQRRPCRRPPPWKVRLQ